MVVLVTPGRMKAATAPLFATSKNDGAFFVYLERVDASGRVTYLTEGILHTRHRPVSNAAAPYAQLELRRPGIRTILNSYDVLGGPHNINFIYTTKRFREENPKTYAAFLAAFADATALVNSDKRKAAEIYLKLSPEKVSVDELVDILKDPQFISSMTPMGVTKFVEFAYRTGTIKKKPDSWKDLFFPEAQALPGG